VLTLIVSIANMPANHGPTVDHKVNTDDHIASVIAFNERCLDRARWLYRLQYSMSIIVFVGIVATGVWLGSVVTSQTVPPKEIGLSVGGFSFCLISVWLWSPWTRAMESLILISAFEGLHFGFVTQIEEAELIEDATKRRNRLAKVVREHVDNIVALSNPYGR
jgi:hypothetical protein